MLATRPNSHLSTRRAIRPLRIANRKNRNRDSVIILANSNRGWIGQSVVGHAVACATSTLLHQGYWTLVNVELKAFLENVQSLGDFACAAAQFTYMLFFYHMAKEWWVQLAGWQNSDSEMICVPLILVETALQALIWQDAAKVSAFAWHTFRQDWHHHPVRLWWAHRSSKGQYPVVLKHTKISE